MKTRKSSATSPPLSFNVSDLSAKAKGRSETLECHNLRHPDSDSSSLVAVAMPRRMFPTDFPGYRLIAGGEFTQPDGKSVVIACNGDKLLMLIDGLPSYFIGFEGPYEAAMVVGESLYLLRGETKSPLCFDFIDGLWVLQDLSELPAPVAIERSDETVISADLPDVVLSGAYDSRSSNLLPSDVRKLGDALRQAYVSVCDRAAARGCFVQPVLARYRLVGSGGNSLYLSPPVLLAPDAGLQLVSASFTLSGNGFSLATGSSVSARCFRVRLRQLAPLGKSWARLVNRIELLVSPELHPLDTDAQAVCTFGRFTTSDASLSVNLPGVGDRADYCASLMRSKVFALLARIDTSLKPLATALYEISGDGSISRLADDSLFSNDCRNTSASLKALRAALSAPLPSVSAESVALSGLSLPHSPCAGLGAAGGDVIAFGQLSSRPFPGWLPQEFVISDPHSADGSFVTSACRVVFSDGGTRVRRAYLPAALGSLSPLLCYPRADAVAIELYHGSHFARFPLTPDPSGRFAVFLNDDLLPFDLSVTDYPLSIPDDSPLISRYPGLIALASASDPLKPIAVTAGSRSGLAAIVASPGSAGSLDSATARFYLCGSGGIDSLTVNSTRNRLNIRRIDPRPVKNAAGVCIAGQTVIALAGDELVRVNSHNTSTLAHVSEALSVAWDSARNEIICCHTDHASVFNASGQLCYTRSLPPLDSFINVNARLIATSSDGVFYDLLSSSDNEEVECIFTSRLPFDAGRQISVRLIDIPLRGKMNSAVAEIHADEGDFGLARKLSSFTFSGLMRHIPPLKVIVPHAHALSLTLRIRTLPSHIRLIDN